MPATGSSPAVRSLQARAAAARRWNLDDADTVAAEFATEKLAEHIQRAVDAAPPLSDEQLARLRTLLGGAE